MTTGGTARGPVDQLHPALTRLVRGSSWTRLRSVPVTRWCSRDCLMGARRSVAGQSTRGCGGFVSLAWPLIDASRGVPLASLEVATLAGDISAPPHSHRLLPSKRHGLTVTPVMHHGPAMLSGLAEANVLAVAPPGGASDGETVSVLPLPWSSR